MPSTADYALLADPPIALLTGAYRRFGNLVIFNKWNDLCQCNGAPSVCQGFQFVTTGWTGNTNGVNVEEANWLEIDTHCQTDGVYVYGGANGLAATVVDLFRQSDHANIGTANTPAVSAGARSALIAWNGVSSIDLPVGNYYLGIRIAAGAFTQTSPATTVTYGTLGKIIGANSAFLAGGYGYPTSAYGLLQQVEADLCTLSTPVIPPDPTPPPQPTGWPTYPGPAACTTINDVCVAIGQLLSKLEAVRAEVQILQRYRVPFGLINGADHPGLTGTGNFVVGGLRGVRIRITSPTSPGTWPGNPPYVKDIGWVSIDDGGGMYAEKRVTQTSFYWLHDAMQLATRFQWGLNPGVTIDVLELFPEP